MTGVFISGRYTGGKKTELRHEPSGTVIQTAAPTDNNGDGSSFSPTDLLAASLGACMLTVMSIYAERHSVGLEGMEFRVEKIMHPDPRRIGELPLTIRMPAALTPEQREILERAAHTCPVHRSLSPEIKIEVNFVYDVQG